MIRWILRMLFKLKGWKIDTQVPKETERCVIIAAPHTSNWDFVFARASYDYLKIPLRFTIKKEWMQFPYSIIFNPLGGIAINRKPKKEGEERISLVSAMADLFKTNKRLSLMVTPEGTRKKVTEWKTGFYYVAMEAGVPICLGYLDYQKKIAGVSPTVIYPSGDYDTDMRKIMDFYKNIHPCHPENFSLDLRYI